MLFLQGLFLQRFMFLAGIHYLNVFFFAFNFAIKRIFKAYTPKVYDFFCFLSCAIVWMTSMPNISSQYVSFK